MDKIEEYLKEIACQDGGLINRFEIDQLIQLVREECKPKWIPVGERLPEVTDKVIACTVDGKVIQCCYWAVGEFCPTYLMGKHGTEAVPIPIEKVTHWQPLPEAPTHGE